MDELKNFGLVKGNDFFDDGDNDVVGRMDVGENPEDYGLYELSDCEIEERQQQQQQSEQQSQDERDKNYDFRMENSTRNNIRQSVQPPKALRMKGTSQNTGPKGVKRDYNEAKKNMKINRVMAEMRHERNIQEAAMGMARFSIENPLDSITAKNNDFSDDSDDLFSDDSEDERRFLEYKANRIREVQASLPSFGNYARAEKFEELASMVRTNHELTWLVVHVYQNDNRACLALHLALENIARQFSHVCFLRIRSTDAMTGFSEKGLPTLLLYRGQNMEHSLIRVDQYISAAPTDLQVVKFLSEYGVLKMPTGNLEKLDIRHTHTWDEGYESGNEKDGESIKIRSSAYNSGGRGGVALDSDDDSHNHEDSYDWSD